MNNIKTKAVRLSLAAAGLVLAASAHATTWVDITSTVTSSIINDIATYNFDAHHAVTFTDFASAPVQVAFYAQQGQTPQGPSDIKTLINGSNLFGLPNANLTYVAGVNLLQNSTTINQGPHYDYLAVHFATGEMLFHWTNGAPNPFTITSDKLSNYRAFTSAVPEPETYGMLLAGLGLVGFLARRRKAA